MEALLKQLGQLPKALAALPAGLKLVLVVGALAAIGVGAWSAVSSAEAYQYAFTNLTPEDAAEAASALKAAGVPFRLDAGGSALAVPGTKVYDARLLLAGAGLPRGGGVGFEIFDRGDLGVSEFTQRVNLRRATEGELARTISKLAQVRSARVHLTLAEKGLYRDQDKPPSAAVVVNLQPGRTLADREIAGIRHLVSSSVPGLSPTGVTVVDGRGEVLSAEGAWGEAVGFERRLERDLQQRVVDLLEQAVGAGAAGGVAGAAANQPLQPAATTASSRGGASSTMEDQVKNYDVSRTTTTTVARVPRLQRISVAVLVDGLNGQPRPDAELQRLGELAKRAVGFDADRGDTFDISSAPFARSEESGAGAAPVPAAPPRNVAVWAATGVGALLRAAVLLLALRGKRAPPPGAELPILPGARVAEIEAALARDAAGLPPPAPGRPALLDPATALRERARELATKDPTRAAHILKAWMASGGAASAAAAESTPASRS